MRIKKKHKLVSCNGKVYYLSVRPKDRDKFLFTVIDMKINKVIEDFTLDTVEDALFYFKKYEKKYSEKHIVKPAVASEAYVKFAQDYATISKNCGDKFGSHTDFNLSSPSADRTVLYVGKHCKKWLLEEEIKKYNLSAFFLAGYMYLENPIIDIRGNTLQAKYMCDGFKSLGYADIVERVPFSVGISKNEIRQGVPTVKEYL